MSNQRLVRSGRSSKRSCVRFLSVQGAGVCSCEERGLARLDHDPLTGFDTASIIVNRLGHGDDRRCSHQQSPRRFVVTSPTLHCLVKNDALHFAMVARSAIPIHCRIVHSFESRPFHRIDSGSEAMPWSGVLPHNSIRTRSRCVAEHAGMWSCVATSAPVLNNR